MAFFGYNLVHVFERYAFPILTVIFLIAAGVILSKAHPGASHHTIPGAFLLAFGASFGYAVGWNPYASDYTRYFKPDASKARDRLVVRVRPVPVLRAARDRRRGRRHRRSAQATRSPGPAA